MNTPDPDKVERLQKPIYEEPKLDKIELTPDETLIAGCKTDTFGDCLQGFGPTFEFGS
jgi:hypothetical protein